MENRTHDAQKNRPKTRYYAIPFELVYEAQQWNVTLGDTCIEALRRKIQEKKDRLYGTTRPKE